MKRGHKKAGHHFCLRIDAGGEGAKRLSRKQDRRACECHEHVCKTCESPGNAARREAAQGMSTAVRRANGMRFVEIRAEGESQRLKP